MFSKEQDNGIKINQVLSGRSNVYLIQTPTRNILIDTAKSNKRRLLITKLNQLGIDCLDYLILTHTHYDHCENAQFIQAAYKSKIVASKHAEAFAKTGSTPIPKGTNKVTKRISCIGNRTSVVKNYAPFNIDILFEYELELTDQIKLIATPGHSVDSISIVVGDKIALVGDAMFGIFKKSIFPPYADDVPGVKNSWKKLFETNSEIFLPGHGKPIARKKVELALINQL